MTDLSQSKYLKYPTQGIVDFTTRHSHMEPCIVPHR